MKKYVGILLMGIAVLLATASIVSCTENERAKAWGGTMSITLDPGQKLVNVTWKETEMWLLTRPMRPDEQAETYKFAEKSSWGVMEGTVIITESGGKIGYNSITTPEMDISPATRARITSPPVLTKYKLE